VNSAIKWSDVPAFRHDPRKATLVISEKEDGSAKWLKEPAVCGYTFLTHKTKGSNAEIPVPVCSTPAVVVGAGVVVAGYDGRIRFYNRALDKTFWIRKLHSPVYASLTTDPSRNTVVVATTAGLVACVDLRGHLVWSLDTQVPIYATPAILSQSDTLVVAAFNSRLIGLELGTGKKVFDLELPEPWHSGYGGSAANRDPYASPTVMAEDTVIICCAEHVLAFRPDGTELWRREIGHSIRASPAALNALGQVAVCSVDGRCIFFDSRSGQEQGAVVLGGKITASPAVSGDVLAVGTVDGMSFGIDITKRKVAWSSPRGAPRDHTSFTVMPDGNFIATSSHGNVIGTRREDGRFLWETSQLLGISTHDSALDITPIAAQNGSMYCGSYSGVLYHLRFQPESPASNGGH